MTGPRHISMCINEWLDGCPYNLPDTLAAIRDELNPSRLPVVDATEHTKDVA